MKVTLSPPEQRTVMGVVLLVGFAILLRALVGNSAMLNFLQ